MFVPVSTAQLASMLVIPVSFALFPINFLSDSVDGEYRWFCSGGVGSVERRNGVAVITFLAFDFLSPCRI